MPPTELLFRGEPYARTCDAHIGAVEPGAVRLDRTVFYPEGGGQPGDTGVLRADDGSAFAVSNTRKGEDADDVIHLIDPDSALPAPGSRVVAELDWERRYRHMRMHTCLHLLSAVIDAPVTGGQLSAEKGRLDFDVDTKLDKAAVQEELNALIAQDFPVGARWISDEALAEQPELVRTMRVKPPTGQGRVRLIDVEGDRPATLRRHPRRTDRRDRADRRPQDREQGQAEPARHAGLWRPIVSDGGTPLVVTAAWLAAESGADSNVRVLDGSWHLPTMARDPAAEFLEAHIPGAAFFDIDGICDPDSSLPHMLPSPEHFARSVSALGIGNDSHVVVYDTVGLYSAARVWWMFRIFGHGHVSVLSGGLPRWQAGRPPGGERPAHDRAGIVHGASLRRHAGPARSSKSARRSTRAARRSWMRAPPRASRARIRGPGPIFRAAISRAAATSPSAPSSTMAMPR